MIIRRSDKTVRQRLILKKLLQLSEKLKVWHKKFAWFPIRLNENELIWLNFVERSYPDIRVCEIHRYYIGSNSELGPMYGNNWITYCGMGDEKALHHKHRINYGSPKYRLSTNA